MPKPELGTKRTCVSCGTKFYDLKKEPAACPNCGTEQPAEVPRPRRTGGNVVEEKRPKKPAPEDADVEVEPADDEAEEDVLESTDDLEDDADPIPGEIDVETETDEKDT